MINDRNLVNRSTEITVVILFMGLTEEYFTTFKSEDKYPVTTLSLSCGLKSVIIGSIELKAEKAVIIMATEQEKKMDDTTLVDTILHDG
jgi:hypothetical protein